MQTVSIGSVVHHIAENGDPSGRAIVFANSLGTDLRIWDAVLPLLPPGLRVLRYDMRGHGLSDCPPGPGRSTTSPAMSPRSSMPLRHPPMRSSSASRSAG